MASFVADSSQLNGRQQTQQAAKCKHVGALVLVTALRKRSIGGGGGGEGCEPAVAGGSQNLIWDEGERQGVVKKWRNTAQNAVWEDCNVTAPKEWRQNWEGCGSGGCCRETEKQDAEK